MPGEPDRRDLAHHDRAGVRRVGFHEGLGDAVVADHRIRVGDDLPAVARVGQRLLVAGHRGVEDDLAGHRPGGAGGVAVEARAVLEQQVRGLRDRSCADLLHREAARAEGHHTGGDRHQDAAVELAAGEAAVG